MIMQGTRCSRPWEARPSLGQLILQAKLIKIIRYFLLINVVDSAPKVLLAIKEKKSIKRGKKILLTQKKEYYNL
jgi:hypothetical protein